MSEPLTPGEPLSPAIPPAPSTLSADQGRVRLGAPLSGPKPAPAAGAKPPKPPKPAKPRRGGLGRFVMRFFSLLFGLLVLGGVAGGVVAYSIVQRYSTDLPDLDSLRHYQPRVMSRLYTSDSRLLSELATERRIFVPSGAIPDLVKHAFISAEDQNFFTHRGVDPVAILRAGVTDLMQYGQGRRPIGASTITQQVAKNMLLGNEVSIRRKVRELVLAWRIEESLSKDRILELYLNEIYLGLQAYGVASAAQAYFNKSLDELTLPEAAFLAALPKAPNNYNPFRQPDAARARRDFVIDRMASDRVITAEQASAAKATPIVPSAFRRPETIPGADYFAEEVRRKLIEQFGADQTTQGGLVVRTTVDPALQLAADKALHDGLIAYDRRRGGWRGPVGKIDSGPSLRTNWTAQLAQAAQPPGMLSEWRLGVVIEIADAEAKIGFMERAPGSSVVQPKLLPLQIADLDWARPMRDDKMGPVPRKLGEVVQPGDLVMVEPVAAVQAAGRVPAKPERLILRQIPLVQGALVSIEPSTGRVVAMSGGWSFEMSQFNRATQAARQPGSSFKPYVYLTAMKQNIPPSQRVLDAPFVVDQGAAGKWRPHNDENDFNGPVPLRVALEKSLNLVTVRLADKIGMNNVAETAIAFHVVDNMPRVLPAALGAVETTVMRQAGGYASLAAGGREVIPVLYDSVQDRDGKVIWRAPGLSCQGCDAAGAPPAVVDARKQIADAASVFQVVTMMTGVMQRGTGFPVNAGFNRALAGKTGTSSDFIDAWFGGFSPDLVTVVWVGFDKSTESLGNNAFGATTAGPIWRDYMMTALKNRPNLKFIPPPGISMGSWDTGSGTVTDAFKPGQTPGGSGAAMGSGGGGGSTAVDGASGAGGTAPHAAGVDSSLGGLY